MTIQITREGLQAILPGAPAAILDNVAIWQAALDKAGITKTRRRLAYFFANIEHETNGFRIPGLTESIAYTPERAAQIWPSRFRSAADVRAKFGSAHGWQKRMFDDVYGNRMGNRPGTDDGSRYIGRGGPQWTGRDGYEALQRITGIRVVDHPELAARLENQPQVCAAFVTWKNLNAVADAGDFTRYRRLWNGGLIGFADVQARRAGNEVAINALPDVDRVITQAKVLPGKDAPVPPQLPKGAHEGAGAVASAGAAGVAAQQAGMTALRIIVVMLAVAIVAAVAVHLWRNRER